MRLSAFIALACLLPISACAQELEQDSVIVSEQRKDSVVLQTDVAQNDFVEAYEIRLNGTVVNLTPLCREKIWDDLKKNLPQNKDKEDLTRVKSIDDIINSAPECAAARIVQPNAAITCQGVPQQGGAVLCQTAPNTKVKIARGEDNFYYETSDANGRLIVGFDRDETQNFIEAQGERITFDLATRDYDISRIDGLPPSQVSTFSDAQLKRIRSSSARKKVGFASRSAVLGFKNGFTSPVKDYRKTTNFGAQRILNGEKKRPHYGVDMAAPVGTPIYAPADGVVSLADDDLYFEGAMVMVDHGQGLISMYLHTDEILVEAGQRVSQGEQIATIGSKGRSTGPHLCWRLKWRNRNLDPELLTQWPDNLGLDNGQHADHEH